MLDVKALLAKILEALKPPTTINMKVDSGYYQAIRSSGTGMAIYITLPKAPTNITSSDLQLYNGSNWLSVTISGFAMRGMTCVIRISVANMSSLTANAYGLQGTISLTY